MKYSELRDAPMDELIDRRVIVEQEINKVRDIYLRAAEFELRELREEARQLGHIMHTRVFQKDPTP